MKLGFHPGPHSEPSPSPWVLKESHGRVEVQAGGVAVAKLGRTCDLSLVNGRLVAAAPELLKELEALYALVKGECPGLLENDHHDGMVRAAIAKARGE
jgi:hypothetical protein